MSSHNRARLRLVALVAAALVSTTLVGRAELPEWVRNVEGTGALHDALFRTVPTPGGPVDVRKSSAETYEGLRTVTDPAAGAALFALRGRAAEEKLDPVAAETDWIAFSHAVKDAGAGQLALANFYHRRLQPQKEADALAAAARAPDAPGDRLLPPDERRSWRTFARLFALIDTQQLPDTFAEAQDRAWMAAYPQSPEPYDRLFQFLVSRQRAADAETLLTGYHTAFPADEAWVLKGRAALATQRGATEDALAVYDRSFRPLWGADIVRGYFELLDRTHNLRAFLDRARADIAAHPDDLTPAARLFYYYHRAGNIGAAEQALADFEARREHAARTADELFTLAQLYEHTRNFNEALRYYASIYSLPGAAPADVERAMAAIIETLFAVPEQPLRLGSGDLSFYRDVATLDRGPGVFNGVLSLLFNSESPAALYSQEDSTATSYFHRARGADLLTTFEARFPQSTRRADLNAALIATYETYGESDAVIGRGRTFLATFPNAPQRTAVALAMADAFARKDQVAEEIATYDQLLQELAARSDRVPLGANVTPDDASARNRRHQADPGNGGEAGENGAEASEGVNPRAAAPGARSPEYARILDRYIARLVSRKQLPEALAVYRREIQRNPDDPGLYEAAAQFLQQNNLTSEVEQIYKLALQQFPDTSWHHRLARWYLRQRQAAAFESLTRDVTRTFAGTDLAAYFQDIVTRSDTVNAQMYVQLNRYAHERFPHHLVFVHNLLAAYTTRETSDPAAYEALLRRHWFEDEQLATTFFAMLSRSDRLDAEIAAVRALDGGAAAAGADADTLARTNPLSARFVAEADIWRSQFEAATPVLSALSQAFPADIALGQRAASLHRSLSYVDARETDAAADTLDRLARVDPRSAATLTTLGEVYADRERYDRARAAWNRLPAMAPGQASGYLDAATLFWDYFQFDDALRMIGEGRKTLGDPALYAYEAGAIYEGQRQAAPAIAEYVRGALTVSSASPARSRLLTLARRPAYRTLADQATAAATESTTPSSDAVSLRIDLLQAQNRRADLDTFLSTLLDRTASLELLAEIGAHAERLGFESVRTRALARQIALMHDPIEKLRLRYALVRLYESRQELTLARQTLDTLYHENPRILGIVRQTTDYYWRHDLHREAIDVLKAAAADSYPALKKQFIFEAARKANTIGDYAQARDLLAPLLAESPFDADYLAAVADSYARAKNDAALRDFYTSTIEALRNAPMATDERTRRVAGMRRGLIPALARLNDHAGAIDQYIEIINRYPDDEPLLQEAGRYARQHARTDQLLAYYTKTAADSPRDYRWPMLVARLDTQFEDYPGAIAAYAKAIAIRPDRAEFHTARARLEERLLRFDAAIASYTKTYELTYHDPQWMETIAELHARLGQPDAAAAALRTALIEGRPERAETFFSVAERLERWNLLDAARPFVDRGAVIAGPAGLLQNGTTYVRVYARLRPWPAVFDRLITANDEATKASPEPGDERALASALSARLGELGDVVARDFTPEEKVAVAAFLEQKKTAMAEGEVRRTLLPIVERAGLVETEVGWRNGWLETAGLTASSGQDISRLIDAQTQRLRFADLAQTLARLADRGGVPASVAHARTEAAEAYRKAGDDDGELRVLSRLPLESLSGLQRARYFALRLARDPQGLIALAGTAHPSTRDAIANYVVSQGTADQALAVVRARGQGLPPVWTQAHSALIGLHFARYDAATTGAFTAALGPDTIAARLIPADRKAQLAGDAWLEYGSRFGEYLTYARQPGAADYLPAAIERTPARSDAYAALANFYRDEATGASAAALAEYDHAAALNPRRADVHLRAALILWQQGNRADAIERWKQAIHLLSAPGGRGRAEVAPLVAVFDTLNSRKLVPTLREPLDTMARGYVSRNGTYGADPLFRAVFRASADAPSGTDWLIDLGRAAPNPIDALASIARASWLPDPQRDRVYERIIALSEDAVAKQFGAAQVTAQGQLDGWRVQRVRSLVNTKQAARADELLRAWPEGSPGRDATELVTLETRIAAALHTLDPLLERYAREALPLSLDALREAATALRNEGETASARQIMEFVYLRQLDRDELTAPTFLGLAEIRLQQGNLPGALTLLRRLTLVVGEPFAQLAACAALLDRQKHPAEALEFRRARVQAVPWDASAQIALARTELAATPVAMPAAGRTAALDRFTQIADSPAQPYATRVDAARAFASAGGRLAPQTGAAIRQPRTELEWLRAPAEITQAAADRPLFVPARLAFAPRIADPAARVALLANGVAASPADFSLRLPLFRAWMAAGKPAAAIEVLQTRLRASRQLTNMGGLSAADRARLARELGDAYEQTDQLSNAVLFFTLARDGQNAATRAALTRRITTLNAEIARVARNVARQPRIGESLDQPQLVRPRIPRPPVAAVTPVATPAPDGPPAAPPPAAPQPPRPRAAAPVAEGGAR
jgi:tetratricopeptide (TPR) repeat protein